MSRRGSNPSDSDLATVSGQLARTARDVTGIAVRCLFGRPAVIETSPRLAGKPNPTLLYLTCPAAATAISRFEATGGVRSFKAACTGDAELREALEVVTEAYRTRRASLAPAGDVRPTAGIGGPEGPEKASCLHAYTAALLAALEGWFEPGDATAGEGREGEPGGERRRAAQQAAGAAHDAATLAWDRFLPPRDTLWCSDDRCARWAGESGASARIGVTPGADDALEGVRVAAIDVGTISVRLLVADLRSGRPEQVVRRAEVTRLGEGLRRGECLAQAATTRTRAVVRGYVEEARRLGSSRIVIAGTSATREALDGTDFVRGLGEENGVAAVVLSGAEEAALAYAGASLDTGGEFVVLDVGGGSTELIRRVARGGVEAVSLDLGASRATERWIHSDPPTAAEVAAVHREVLEAVGLLRSSFGAAGGTLVGVAGTVTTLACLDARLQAYASEAIHLRRLSLVSVGLLIARLAAMTVAERAALPCVQAGRAPVIVGGAVIVRGRHGSAGV